ncbi:MAG: chemotaxis protein CheA [bacterium]|nr:chemotaxis protein CheA [bacterium]
MSSKQDTANSLGTLTAQILALDPSDQEAIAEIGGTLEPLPGTLPDDFKDVAELLNLVLQALQGLYQETVSQPSAVTDAVAMAVEAARLRLSEEEQDDEESFTQASNALAQSLGQDASSNEAEAEPEPEPEVEAEPEPEPEVEAQNDTDTQETSEEDDDKISGPLLLPEDADLELLSDFIVECVDHIDGAEGSLLGLESNPGDIEEINTVFRAFHTIKGTSGFLGLPHIQGLAHLAENLLDRAREDEIKIEGGYADLTLESCDILRTMITALDGINAGDEMTVPSNYDNMMTKLKNADDAAANSEVAEDEMRVGDVLVGKGQATRQEVEEAAQEQGERPIGEVLVEKKVVPVTEVAKAIRTQKKIAGRASKSETTIRVGTGRLDNLINMVGELVIAQSMVTEDPNILKADSPRLLRNVSHAGKIIRELQDLTMSLRMVPLKGTFQKMARLVRDLGRKAGKDVQFVTEGDDTEIDRNMVEVLNDPLVHMIRNSVDHGVEPADQRKADGKNPTGTIGLRAYHAAGNVVIELTDDGKGLDRQKIIAKAVEKGIMDANKELTDSEAFNLIFQPGFSTAAQVTEISGRGVGMDVVRKGIEALRGRIDVSSQIGDGSTFAMRLPLTMAITDAMLLRVGKEHYLLPTASIEHSFRPTKDCVSSVAGRGEMVMLRGDLLPVFRLHNLFGVTGAATNPDDALFICIEGEGKRCALMVDELLGQQQVVIKSLGQTMGQIPGVSGGSILSDGCVGLILDAAGLIKLACEHSSIAA